jgi:hypothetical protein
MKELFFEMREREMQESLDQFYFDEIIVPIEWYESENH